jgi:prepilin-type N-terminal cleavage/methylation domain-containing protein
VVAGRPRAQHGFVLIEVVVSLALVGSVVLALAGALLMLVNSTRSTSEQQQIQLALSAMSESLLVAPYLPCPDDADVDAYNDAYAAWPSRWTPTKPGMQASIVAVEYWNEQLPSADGGERPGFGDVCPTIDQGAQRLTVEVVWKGRRETAQIVTTATP